MSDDHATTTKRRLEEAVAKAQTRATKARQLATEMSAFAQATEGDLYMAKHALQKHNRGGDGDDAPLETVEISAEEEAVMAAAEQSQPSEGAGTRNTASPSTTTRRTSPLSSCSSTARSTCSGAATSSRSRAREKRPSQRRLRQQGALQAHQPALLLRHGREGVAARRAGHGLDTRA